MSAPTLSFGTAQARRSEVGYLRLRVKPAHRSCPTSSHGLFRRGNHANIEEYHALNRSGPMTWTRPLNPATAGDSHVDHDGGLRPGGGPTSL